MTDTALLHRIERLERQHRRLQGTLLLTLVAAVAVVSMAQVPLFPDELRAQRVILVNAAGEPRIELHADTPIASLILRDADDVLVELTGSGPRGAIRYLDESGAMRDLAAPAGVRPLSRR